MFDPAAYPLNNGLYQYLLDLETRRAVRYSHFFSICHVGLDQDPGVDPGIVHSAADILRETVRETDVIGLLNGLTFSILLHNTEIQNACQVAERIRSRVADQMFTAGNAHLRVTASIGCVCFPTHGNDTATVLLRAGEMLAEAKKHGGNKVAVPEQ
jgi:diguanylate cyclase (GGDEF)-like protein